MKSVIINAKNKADLTLLMSLAKKSGMSSRALSNAEIKDWELTQKIEKGMKNPNVSRNELMKSLGK